MLPAVEEVIEKRTLEVMRKPVKVTIPAFGSDASVMGAMALVVREILSTPEVVNSVPKVL